MKEKALEIIDDLEEKVQGMREKGDTDLRTVLHFIDEAYRKIKNM